MGFLNFLHEDILPYVLKIDEVIISLLSRELGDKFGPKAGYLAF